MLDSVRCWLSLIRFCIWFIKFQKVTCSKGLKGGILKVIVVTSCNYKGQRERLKKMFALPVDHDKIQLKGTLPSVVRMPPLYPGSLCWKKTNK